MHDTLIDSVISKRIEEAAAQGDVSLLQQHLSPNYDEHRSEERRVGKEC